MPYALELRQRFTPLQNRYDLVGFRDGTEFGVSHYLFAPR